MRAEGKAWLCFPQQGSISPIGDGQLDLGQGRIPSEQGLGKCPFQRSCQSTRVGSPGSVYARTSQTAPNSSSEMISHSLDICHKYPRAEVFKRLVTEERAPHDFSQLFRLISFVSESFFSASSLSSLSCHLSLSCLLSPVS